MDPTKESHQVLHAFCLNPNVRFESQMPGETILLILRAHPITQLPWLLNSFFLSILLVVLNFILPIVFTPQQIIFFDIFSAALIFSYIWYNFLLWYFNVGIVTDQRIVDINFVTILYKEVTIARLSKVEEVTSQSAGYIGSLFDYGDVFVQTAGEEINIKFHCTPHPARVVEIINGLTPK